MKRLITFICIASIFGANQTLSAQDFALVTETNNNDNLSGITVRDYSENQLTNTDTIPGFEITQEKLKISGTIYENDGITPAKDVVLSIYQKNELGDFVLVNSGSEEPSIYHSATVKTNVDGSYTFYTFIPGTYRLRNELKKIYLVIKESGKEELGMYPLVFDDDRVLSKACRSKLAKRNINSILKLEKKNNLLVSNKDIVLSDNIPAYK